MRALFLPLAILAICPDASAQSFAAQALIEREGAAEAPRAFPRNLDGRPDFGGQWQTAFITSTGRMEGAKTLVVSEAEANEISRRFVAWAHSDAAGVVVDPDVFVSGVTGLSKVGGEYRTSLITSPADGVQHYTAEGKRLDDAAKDARVRPADGPEMRPLFERCMVGVGSAPLTNVPSTMVRQFVQTPDHLAIYSDGNDLRIVGLNATARPAAITSPLGDSVAHWEGDTLVVHTTRMAGQIHNNIITRPESRVIERFSLTGPDEILYRFTVEDTAIYAEPWSAEFVLQRSDHQVLEYACHEGNYSMINILQAGRVLEKRGRTGS